MFTLPISQEQKVYAWTLVSNVNYGNRGRFDGNKEKQYTGLLGETVMADILKINRPKAKVGWDEGIDFVVYGQNIDLKTMGRTCDVKMSYVHNLLVSQVEQGLTDIYVFASINKLTSQITFCGALRKIYLNNHLIKTAGTIRTRKDGTHFELKEDIYEIPQASLKQVNSSLELKWSIDQLRCV